MPDMPYLETDRLQAARHGRDIRRCSGHAGCACVVKAGQTLARLLRMDGQWQVLSPVPGALLIQPIVPMRPWPGYGPGRCIPRAGGAGVALLH